MERIGSNGNSEWVILLAALRKNSPSGFNINQAQSGGSGSTGSLALVGSTMSISYVNYAGSTLELELWDGSSSNYWCTYLPATLERTGR